MNKWDLLEKDSTTARTLEKVLQEKLRIYDFIPIIFISALNRQRIYKLIDLVKSVDADQNRRIATNELNTLVGDEIRAYPPQSRTGKEVKINYITQVRSKPPVFAFFCNDPKLIDDNYRRYLENKIRSHFAFTGVPIVLSFKKKN